MLIAPVKATDFKLQTSSVFSGTVWTQPLKNFQKGGVCKNSLGRDMHSHKHLLVLFIYLFYLLIFIYLLFYIF